jgi:hypothetical protein
LEVLAEKRRKMVWTIIGLIVAYLMLRVIRELWKHSDTFFAAIGILAVAAIWIFSGFWNALIFLIGYFIIYGFLLGSDTTVSTDKGTYTIRCSECDYNHVEIKYQDNIQVVWHCPRCGKDGVSILD